MVDTTTDDVEPPRSATSLSPAGVIEPSSPAGDIEPSSPAAMYEYNIFYK